MYDKMPFGLMNAGETFQQPIDISFVGDTNKFIVIYVDNLDGEKIEYLVKGGILKRSFDY